MEYINSVFNTIIRTLFIPTESAPRLAQYQYYQKQKRLTFPEKKEKEKEKKGWKPNKLHVNYNNINDNEWHNEWHMYHPEHCLRVFVVYRESLLSIVEHYRNQKHEALLRGNIDERMNENRMHSYVCALYNYTHIGDYARFNVEYQSDDIYLSVRDKTLLDLGVDLDHIGNTILIALAVTASNSNSTDEPIHSVNIYLRNSTFDANDNKTCILTTIIDGVEYNIHQS
jgi:hypothetical protein